jgi:hypothetical protein
MTRILHSPHIEGSVKAVIVQSPQAIILGTIRNDRPGEIILSYALPCA